MVLTLLPRRGGLRHGELRLRTAEWERSDRTHKRGHGVPTRHGCTNKRGVLVPGGRLAIWDVTLGPAGVPHFPLPWADYPDRSHLVPADHLRTTIETAGFAVVHWDDLSKEAALVMENFLSAPPDPLGLHLFVENFAGKARNLTDGLSSGNLAVI
jgi:sarcosine/dimethylglycine N-methyltransferase